MLAITRGNVKKMFKTEKMQCVAFIRFDPASGIILNSYNISNIVVVSTGNIRGNFLPTAGIDVSKVIAVGGLHYIAEFNTDRYAPLINLISNNADFSISTAVNSVNDNIIFENIIFSVAFFGGK